MSIVTECVIEVLSKFLIVVAPFLGCVDISSLYAFAILGSGPK